MIEIIRANCVANALREIFAFSYESLVAEVSLNGQFLFLLDRESGWDAVCIAFPVKDGKLGSRVPLIEFI